MINQWLLIVSCQILMIINYWLQMINYYHYYNVFIKTWTNFFWSGRQWFGNQRFVLFSMENSFSKHWLKLWRNLGMKAIDTPVLTCPLLSNCYFFEEKKNLFPMDAWGLTNSRLGGIWPGLDDPVKHFVTLWNDPMWRFIILITINIYIKR